MSAKCLMSQNPNIATILFPGINGSTSPEWPMLSEMILTPASPKPRANKAPTFTIVYSSITALSLLLLVSFFCFLHIFSQVSSILSFNVILLHSPWPKLPCPLVRQPLKDFQLFFLVSLSCEGLGWLLLGSRHSWIRKSPLPRSHKLRRCESCWESREDEIVIQYEISHEA